MDSTQSEAPASSPFGRALRLALVFAGILVGQFALYGRCLVGEKLLLSLDCLAEPNVYLPRTAETAALDARDAVLSDMVLSEEPARRFARSEWLAGRIPTWTPRQFAGAPFTWPVFSPYSLFKCSVASPVIVAWSQLLLALVAGLGMYAFLRRALAVSFWPAALAAWCYPLTAFFVLWQGYLTSAVVGWLPWVLLSVHRVVRAPDLLGVVGLALATALVLVSGQLDLAGQVLLVSGAFALWSLWFASKTRRASFALCAGWALGFLLASPYVFSVLDYTRTGARMERRGAGNEERPPVGVSALPLIVMPYLRGSTARPSVPLDPTEPILIESSATAYGGALWTLCLAPLAWCVRRRRAVATFFGVLALVAVSWCLDLPGFVQVLRLPGLNLLSHNRLTFAAGFAFVVLGALGLEALARREVSRRAWMTLPAVALGILGAWCAFRAVILPEPLVSQLEAAIRGGAQFGWLRDVDDVQDVQAWFTQHYLAGALVGLLGVLFWLHVRSRRTWSAKLTPIVAVLAVGELLWSGLGRSPQCDPALDYPPVPALRALADAGPGRVIGKDCLPAALAGVCGLRDVRGYDAVDPAEYTELLTLARDPSSQVYSYAATQWLCPTVEFVPEGGVRLAPVLDLLGVRWVVFRGEPPSDVRASFASFDYWVLENSRALPRAFVPSRVERLDDGGARLARLAAPDFDPRAVAYVEGADAPPGPSVGVAEIVEELPTRLVVSARMASAGLVVVADLWNAGWHAYANGAELPILRADHALRGVVLPAGERTIEFRYEPAAFAWGVRLSALASLLLGVLTVVGLRRRGAVRG